MNAYLTEQLNRQRQAELLQEAQELRKTQGSAPRPSALLDSIRAWALQLAPGGSREPLWRKKGGRLQP
jgi:hypothetical protein